MLIATFHDAIDALLIGGVIVVAAVAGAVWLARHSLRSRHASMKLVGGLVAVALGGGGVVIGGLVFLLGLAIANCPPDSYECPL